MLVLTRKNQERILIGDDIVGQIVSGSGNQVQLGIDAPADLLILREEVAERLKQERGHAA